MGGANETANATDAAKDTFESKADEAVAASGDDDEDDEEAVGDDVVEEEEEMYAQTPNTVW